MKLMILFVILCFTFSLNSCATESKQKETYVRLTPELLATVEKGWTKTQLLQFLGTPSSLQGEVYYYNYIESRIYGGYYDNYKFTLKDDKIIEIMRSYGHESRSPKTAR